MTKKTVIIGGGLSGLSAAYFLQEKGTDFLLYEAEERFGGLCKTEVSENGFFYDYTGHLLHFKDPEIKSLVLDDLLKSNVASHERKSFIYLKKRYIKYPFQKNLYRLPFFIKLECFLGYLFRQKKEGEFLKNWSLSNFGKGISKYFMIPYNEKLWQLGADKMTTSWMKGFVPKPSFKEVFNSTFFDAKDDVGYNASFYYPKKGGIQALIDGFVAKLPIEKLLNNTKITEIYLKNMDPIISTIPLKTLVLDVIKDADEKIIEKAKKLQANFVLNVNIGTRTKITDKHWVYFPEDDFIFYRIGFINNFSESMTPNLEYGSIYTEIASKKEPIADLEKRVIADLIKAGIIESLEDVVDIKTLKLENAYVNYDQNRDEIVAEILEYLKAHNIYSIGRYGRWEYSAMEDAILEAKECVLRF